VFVAKVIANSDSRKHGKRRSPNRRRYDASKWIAKFSRFTFRFNRRRSKSRGKLFFRLMQQAACTPPRTYDTLVGVPNRVALQAYVYQHPAVLKRNGHAPRGLDHHPEGCTCERPYCTARRIGEI
jgi:hypothetical protein